MNVKLGKLPKKTDADAEREIDDIISGKNKSFAARMVRNFIKMRKGLGDTDEVVRENLIREFKIKYGLLQTGKITPGELLKQSEAEIRAGKKVE